MHRYQSIDFSCHMKDWDFFLGYDSNKYLIKIFDCKAKRVRLSYTALFQW